MKDSSLQKMKLYYRHCLKKTKLKVSILTVYYKNNKNIQWQTISQNNKLEFYCTWLFISYYDLVTNVHFLHNIYTLSFRRNPEHKISYYLSTCSRWLDY